MTYHPGDDGEHVTGQDLVQALVRTRHPLCLQNADVVTQESTVTDLQANVLESSEITMGSSLFVVYDILWASIVRYKS